MDRQLAGDITTDSQLNPPGIDRDIDANLDSTSWQRSHLPDSWSWLRSRSIALTGDLVVACVMKMMGVEYVVDYILERVGNLEEVYLVGKLANGQDAEVINIILVGDNLDKVFLIEQIEKAEKKINKKIQYIIYSSKEFNVDKIKEGRVNPLLLWTK